MNTLQILKLLSEDDAAVERGADIARDLSRSMPARGASTLLRELVRIRLADNLERVVAEAVLQAVLSLAERDDLDEWDLLSQLSSLKPTGDPSQDEVLEFLDEMKKW